MSRNGLPRTDRANGCCLDYDGAKKDFLLALKSDSIKLVHSCMRRVLRPSGDRNFCTPLLKVGSSAIYVLDSDRTAPRSGKARRHDEPLRAFSRPGIRRLFADPRGTRICFTMDIGTAIEPSDNTPSRLKRTQLFRPPHRIVFESDRSGSRSFTSCRVSGGEATRILVRRGRYGTPRLVAAAADLVAF